MVRLLITSGRGPAECRLAVGHVLVRLSEEAALADVGCDIALEGPDTSAPASASVILTGVAAASLAARWIGSVLWICPSPVRPHHKRKNWFIGVVALPEQAVAPRLRETDVRFDTLRAGGPGGQHQNKTESAVRATHVPTGVTVVAREERSQQRNKALALQRLADLASLAADATARAAAERVHASHDAVQRGRPVRTFTGPWFVER